MGANRQRLATDWLSKARFAAALSPGEPWPAWSTGEVLAVALILGDTDELAAMGYTREEALNRLRYDLGLPSVAVAGAVFDQMSAQLAGPDGVG